MLWFARLAPRPPTTAFRPNTIGLNITIESSQQARMWISPKPHYGGLGAYIHHQSRETLHDAEGDLTVSP